MRPNKPFCDNSHFYAGFDDPGAAPESGVPAENKG
jgi:CDGSH-type Zn-finger protein